MLYTDVGRNLVLLDTCAPEIMGSAVRVVHWPTAGPGETPVMLAWGGDPLVLPTVLTNALLLRREGTIVTVNGLSPGQAHYFRERYWRTNQQFTDLAFTIMNDERTDGIVREAIRRGMAD